MKTNVEILIEQVDILLTNLYDSGEAEDPDTGVVRSDISELEKTLASVRKELRK